jgi:hypothetical protein
MDRALLDSTDPQGGRTITVPESVRDALPAIVGVLAVLLVVALLALLWLGRRVRSLTRRVDALTRGADGTDLEGVLGQHLDEVHRIAAQVQRLDGRTGSLELDARRSLQRVGMVRFNPFEDTGGNQSFALAVLDADLDGFVVSSLHSRNGTRIYAKVVNGGRSDGALSVEETEALRQAMAGGRPAERATAERAAT